MRFWRFVSVLLCAAMCAAVLAGCEKAVAPDGETPPNSSAEHDRNEETPQDTSLPDSVPGESAVIDYDAAYAAFPADTVMVRLGNDIEITWQELFFYLCGRIVSIENSIGTLPDWSYSEPGQMTIAELVKEYSTQDAVSYRVYEYGAGLIGVTLSDEDIASIEADYKSSIEAAGGEEEFLKLLREESKCYSKELYDTVVRSSYFGGLCFQEMYGPGGSFLTDEEAAEYTANDGYLRAKHILRLKTEDSGEVMEEDPAYLEAVDILEKLDSYKGDNFNAYFDELMNEYSEDTGGLSSYPGGYLFQDGDMVPEFYEACVNLGMGEYSGIVETTYGYHILYRLPINYEMVPFAYYKQGRNDKLRLVAAYGMFEAVMSGWIEQLGVSYSDEYNSIDVAEIFKVK